MTDSHHGTRCVARVHGRMDRENGRDYFDDTAPADERSAAYAAGYREGYAEALPDDDGARL